MNKREEIFARHLENQGKCWAFEPIRFEVNQTTYTPDFYCPDEDTFYEVVGTRQAISQRAKKIADFIEIYPHIKFKLVHPNGEKYNYKSRKNGERMIVRGFSVDRKLSESLDEYAKGQDRSASWVIRKALKLFLPAYQTIKEPSKYYNDSKGILRGKK